MAHQLPVVPDLSQREVFTTQNCHLVEMCNNTHMPLACCMSTLTIGRHGMESVHVLGRIVPQAPPLGIPAAGEEFSRTLTSPVARFSGSSASKVMRSSQTTLRAAPITTAPTIMWVFCFPPRTYVLFQDSRSLLALCYMTDKCTSSSFYICYLCTCAEARQRSSLSARLIFI